MKNVNEVSKLTGVSIRTLHYYDEIGLLKPTERTESGYRLYDDDALEKLATVLMFRELEFPLQKIKEITESENYNTAEALKNQITLLKQKKEHFEKLIAVAQKMLSEGIDTMDIKQIEDYRKEAKEKWGNTEEYKEFETKQVDNCGDGFMEVFAEFGKLKAEKADCESVQNKVKELQEYITEHYYTCTKETLFSLGQMYVCDDRFKENIDAKGGNGTAEFVNKAIKEYCK